MKKISIIVMSIIGLMLPIYVYAEEEANTNPTPTPTPTATSTPEPTPTATPVPTPTATPIPTATPTPTSTPTPTATATPEPTATPEEEKPIENTLSKIEVTGGTISPKFNSTTYEYTIKVTDDKNFSIKYEKSDDRTLAVSPELNSSNQLKAIVANNKKTTIKVTYTDEKNKQHINTYKITLNYTEPEKSSKLSGLKVDGYEFDKTFQSGTPTYSFSIPYAVDMVTIVATPEDSDAEITY